MPMHETVRTWGLFQPGRNCWRVDRAHRFRMIQDAADYFRLVRDAILEARESIFILGWDIAADVDLLPGTSAIHPPTRLDRLLGFVTRRRRQLRCYVLIWDYGSLYALERDPFTRMKFGLRTPRRVRFAFDDRHPLGASHHQKIVVIDDALAFCGGIDLTNHRWDTTAHRVDEPERLSGGRAYGPYHEVQAMVDGPAAASLARLARERWRALGGRTPAARDGASTRDLWPDDLPADLEDIDVAIARTMPAAGSDPAVRECEALFLDSIHAARSSIFIESQYFTNATLCAALKARLAEREGPEVIVVTPRECHGWLEQQTIGALRGEVLRDIAAADRHGRLRLLFPLASRRHDVATFVHSKVMFVDDEFARIGSANFSHRSMGVDTECDLAIDACGDPRVRERVRRMRNRLLAEHLGLEPEAVDDLLRERTTLCAAIDASAGGDRCLARIDLSKEAAEPPSAAVRAATDPDEPIGFGSTVGALIPSVDAARGRGPIRIWILPAAVITAATVMLWRTSDVFRRTDLVTVRRILEPLPDAAGVIPIAIAAFLVASVVLIPQEVLAVAAGLLLGGSGGAIVATAGALAAAAAGYGAGRLLGPQRVARWMTERSYRSGRAATAHGVAGVAALRLAGNGSAGAINLLCGAARVPPLRFLLGSLIGLTPVVASLAAVGGLLRQALLWPTVWHGALAIGAALILLFVASMTRTVLRIRQFGPALARHRNRAEFG